MKGFEVLIVRLVFSQELAVVWLESVLAAVDVCNDTITSQFSVTNCRVDNQLPLTPFEVALRKQNIDDNVPFLDVSHRFPVQLCGAC